ncbi:MAG: TldD/PmbA family protein, partial [Burkholderiaceae bacterium]|nr:TldD/PmbA family protein [Burkholderiaceae bacterium]
MEALVNRFRALAPAVDYCSIRVVDEDTEIVSVRQDVPEPVQASRDRGAMLTVVDGDGIGYAATSDLSDAGLKDAMARAREWARLARGRSVFEGAPPELPRPKGRYATPVAKPLRMSKAERLDLLMRESAACRIDGRIVDWAAMLWT